MQQDPYHSPSFEQQFRASLHQQPAPQAPQPAPTGGKSNKALFVFIAIVVVAVIIPIAVLLVFKAGSNTPEEDNDPEKIAHQDNVYDQNTLDGNLNESFKAAAEKGAHASYTSITTTTRYASYLPKDLCEYMGLKAADFNDLTNLKYAAKVETLNSNALNYYLDLDRVIIMSFLTKDQIDETPTVYVIYAANLEMDVYYVFSPDSSDTRLSLNQSDLFDDVKGIPDFYIIDPTGGFL